MSRQPRTRPGLAPHSAGSSQEAFEGHLTEALVAGGSAAMRVYEVVLGDWTATATTKAVTDRAGFSGSAGDYVLVILINGEYRPVVVGCESFGSEES